ncbi:MAG: phage integrase N-terminal SAM-like domain-containing protein [Beggiatoa sp.]|nr:phage integrase N-terminal SAM-like domain-containing protein [Beggiatoa sp.]
MTHLPPSSRLKPLLELTGLEDKCDCTRARAPHRKETRHGRSSESGCGSGPIQAAHPAAALQHPHRADLDRIRRFILFHRKRHPKEMGAPEVEAFLTHLAVQGKLAASTQNQALNAIVFLYRQVPKKELGWLERVERAKKPARLDPMSCSAR